MKDNTRTILIILLILTLFIAVAAIYIGIQLQQRGTAPTDIAAACVTGTVRCRTDNPTICPNTHPSDGNPVIDAMVGQLCGGAGAPNSTEFGDCTYFDACAPHINPTANDSQCVGATYTDVSASIIRLSTGESQNGSFIGCSVNIVNGRQLNCFCTQNVAVRSGFTTGTIQCFTDNNNDSCGAKIIAQVTDTPTPTNTPLPTSTPAPTSTPTLTPVATGTPTVTPSASPSITLTVTPTLTPPFSPTATPTPSATVIFTPVLTPIPTLPATALINDSADRLIVAVVLVLGGFGLYVLRGKQSSGRQGSA
jgi:hypothetical protein